MRTDRFRSFPPAKSFAQKRRVPCTIPVNEEEDQFKSPKEKDNPNEEINQRETNTEPENGLNHFDFMPLQFQNSFDEFKSIEDKEPMIDFFIDYGKEDNLYEFDNIFGDPQNDSENLFFNDNFIFGYF